MKYLLAVLALAAASLWWRILDVGDHGIHLASPSGVTVALISGPHGRILIAGGHDPVAASAWLGRALPFHVRKLDALVVTDFRRLAAGTVPELLSRYRVARLLVPSGARRTALSQQIRAMAWRSGAQFIPVASPTELDDGLHRIQLLPVLEEGRLVVLLDGPSGSLALAHAEDAHLALGLAPARLVYRELPTLPVASDIALAAPGPLPGRPEAADLSQDSLDLP